MSDKKPTPSPKEIFEKNENFNSTWMAILLPTISVAVTLFVSYLTERLGFLFTIGVLLANLMVFLIVIVITYILLKHICPQKLQKNIHRISKETKLQSYEKLNISAVGIKGLYPESEIAHMEKNNYYEDIWLISHDLLTEINDGVYAGAVVNNLKKGMNYTYFVPQTLEIETRIKLLKQKCNNSKRLNFYYLDEDFFFLVPNIDFSIYEPKKSSKDGKIGFIGVDIDGLPGRYEAKMSDDFVDVLVAKLTKIIDSKKGGK